MYQITLSNDIRHATYKEYRQNNGNNHQQPCRNSVIFYGIFQALIVTIKPSLKWFPQLIDKHHRNSNCNNRKGYDKLPNLRLPMFFAKKN